MINVTGQVCLSPVCGGPGDTLANLMQMVSPDNNHLVVISVSDSFMMKL